jgi:YesN/AraC family two-component response regulator
MFIRSLNRVARYRENHLWDTLKPIDRIVACVTYEQLRTTIIDLLEVVCSDIEKGRLSHTELLIEQVIDHIAKKLNDPNLGTKAIADTFDMNSAYLSRVFKEHRGLSFSDYINQQRIEISKDLLSSTGRTIADIGQEIGYPESSSFIRFFRKFEGITPGQFREQAG